MAEQTGRAFACRREQLGRLLPDALVLHTGASSVPDALTRGDLDVHVRVSQPAFAPAVARLLEAYEPSHPEIWTDELAVFVVPDAEPETGIALTVVGAEHDRRFLTSWEQLRADPELVAELNALKLAFEGTADVDGYERAKAAFFTTLERRGRSTRPVGQREPGSTP